MRKNNCLSDRMFRFLLLSLAILPAACTDNEEEISFPEGKYPVEFSTQVHGLNIATRATTNNTWTGGETVSITFNKEFYSKEYVADTYGNLTCTDPFYWTKNNETATVTAWYQKGKSYTSAPSSFWIETDQSTEEGYAKSDIIMACQNVSFNDAKKNLRFKHLTAKVIINLKGKESTVENVNTAKVTLINLLNVVQFTATPSDDLSGISVSQTALGAYVDQVTPYECANPPNGYQKSVQALLPPHYAGGTTNFIKITIGDFPGKNYFYRPSPTECNLQSGKQYTYNITVSNSGITDVSTDVKLTESEEWSNADNENISSVPATKTGAF